MSNKKKQSGYTTPKWFNVALDEKAKVHVKAAVVSYIMTLHDDAPLPVANIQTYLAVVPHMICHDIEW